jgi:hypothetical protein
MNNMESEMSTALAISEPIYRTIAILDAGARNSLLSRAPAVIESIRGLRWAVGGRLRVIRGRFGRLRCRRPVLRAAFARCRSRGLWHSSEYLKERQDKRLGKSGKIMYNKS